MARGLKPLRCSHFDGIGACCDSCHEDEDIGYDLVEVMAPGRKWMLSLDREPDAVACCDVASAIARMPRAAWAKARRAQRAEKKAENDDG